MDNTKESRLIELLREEWVTPIDALSKVGIFSLAQRVSELKRERGLHIVDEWRTEGRSRFKAYHIVADIA